MPSGLRGVAALLALAAVLGWGAGPAAAQGKRPITLADMARIRSVGDPQRSPDGKWVAYTLSTVDVEKDKRDSDIWMVSWDGTQQVRMTYSPDGESSPRWSPDGRYLSFLAARGSEEEKKKGSQIWLLERGGGEASKLTDIKGIADYAWSPDGRRLVLVINEDDPASDPEKMEGWKRKAAPPIVIDRYHFKQDRQGYLKRLYSRLWLFDVAGRKAELLTTGSYDSSLPAWSPDGRWIAFVSKRGPDPDRTNDTNIYIVEARAGAEPRAMTRFEGPDGGRPAWSPDGRWIAYLQGDEPKYSAYQQNKVAIVPAAGGEAVVLTASLDRDASGPLSWTPDGRNVVFLVSDDRAVHIAQVSAAGGPVAKMLAGRRTVSGAFVGSDGAMALLAGTSGEVTEVHAFENGILRRLSKQNDEWLAGIQLGLTEDFTCRSKDGTTVNGLLVKPPTYTPGTRYPLILYIHGGPNGQDSHSFSFDREFLAANGYAVLAVNYRGSSGRGSAFQKAIFADWGNKEVADLLAAVDQAGTEGVADTNRLGIGGWSYGGILTDYVIASDPRFKGAVSGAGSGLQLGMYGSDQYVFQYENEIGPPWTARETWMKLSYPFFQANKIKTPTLFMGGEKDFNVPIIGGEQMYQALKSLGVDTQLVIYPGQFHGLSLPSYQRDRLQRYVDWFDKYVKAAR